MYCKNCGQEVNEGDRFCNNCGVLIGYQREESETAETAQTSQTTEKIQISDTPFPNEYRENPTEKLNRRTGTILLSCLVGGLCLILLIVMLVLEAHYRRMAQGTLNGWKSNSGSSYEYDDDGSDWFDSWSYGDDDDSDWSDGWSYGDDDDSDWSDGWNYNDDEDASDNNSDSGQPSGSF